MYESIIGVSSGFQKIEYNWRDMALYALAVGADENDLMYTYEKGMKAIPSFGVLPYFSTVNVEPQIPVSRACSYLAHELMKKEAGKNFPIGLHMSHELIVYQPMNPIKGTMVYEDKVTKIYDRGDRGAVVESEEPVYDESGQLLCLNRSATMIPGAGNFGGEAMPKKTVIYPERKPDYEAVSYMNKTQNVLYRLTGDTAPGHVDPEAAKNFSDRGPFMQGLCSFGYACRMLVNEIIPGEPERVRRIFVQMRSIVYPGTNVRLQAWKTGEGTAVFRLINEETGKSILDNCEFEWNLTA